MFEGQGLLWLPLTCGWWRRVVFKGQGSLACWVGRLVVWVPVCWAGVLRYPSLLDNHLEVYLGCMV